MGSSGDRVYKIRMAPAVTTAITKLFLYDSCNAWDLREIILVALESLKESPCKFPKTANEGQYRYSVTDYPGCPTFHIHYTVTDDEFVDLDFIEAEDFFEDSGDMNEEVG